MDWGAVLDDSGEDTLQVRTGSRVTFLGALATGSYTPLVAYLFTVNYILGVGVLGMPYAFYKAGVVLATLMICLCSLVAYATTMWVANATHWITSSVRRERGRAFGQTSALTHSHSTAATGTLLEAVGLLQWASYSNSYSSIPASASSSASAPNDTDAAGRGGVEVGPWSGLLGKKGRRAGSSSRSKSPPGSRPLSPDRAASASASASAYGDGDEDGDVHHHSSPARPARTAAVTVTPLRSPMRSPGRRPLSTKSTQSQAQVRDPPSDPEVATVVEFFLGQNAKIVYQFALALLTFSGLVAYTQVFVQSFASQFWDQPIWASVLFGVVVLPLSCLDLDEQVRSQVVMSILRFGSLAAVLIGMLVAAYITEESDDTASFPHSGEDSPLFKISGLGLMFSTAVFSQLFQHSVPGLMRPLADEHKASIPYIFGAALVTTCLCYIVTSCAAIWHLGGEVQQSINTNFVGYTWGFALNSAWLPLARAVSMSVVLFPALDTLSIFPLIANTLGSNMHASFPTLMAAPARFVMSIRDSFNQSSTKNLGNTSTSSIADEHKINGILFRILVSVPAILMSSFVEDLSLTLQLAGICGVVVGFSIPALLHIAVCFRIKGIPNLLEEHMCNPLESDLILPLFVLALSICGFVVAVLQVLESLQE